MPRIIDSVLVYDDGPDKSTELDQRMPVATVAGQPRRLDRKDGADPPLTDCSQQALETRPLDAASRAAKIIVDKLDRGPAELPGTVGGPVLAVAALRIVQELVGRRLADVDESTAGQMISSDLGHRRPSRLPAPPRSRTAGLRPVLPAVPSVRGRARRGARPARTGPAECLRSWASLLAFSIPESEWRKPRRASISARKDRRISTDSGHALIGGISDPGNVGLEEERPDGQHRAWQSRRPSGKPDRTQARHCGHRSFAGRRRGP